MAEEINRIYVRKSDFSGKEEFQRHLNTLVNTLIGAESNIVVAYQSIDPNIYIIECNTVDPSLNGVFQFWLTPEELLAIKKHRESPMSGASPDDNDYGNFGGGGGAGGLRRSGGGRSGRMSSDFASSSNFLSWARRSSWGALVSFPLPSPWTGHEEAGILLLGR